MDRRADCLLTSKIEELIRLSEHIVQGKHLVAYSGIVVISGLPVETVYVRILCFKANGFKRLQGLCTLQRLLALKLASEQNREHKNSSRFKIKPEP